MNRPRQAQTTCRYSRFKPYVHQLRERRQLPLPTRVSPEARSWPAGPAGYGQPGRWLDLRRLGKRRDHVNGV